MSDLPTTNNATCGCGRPFACGAAVGHCWCFDLPRLPPTPGATGCLCPDCLAARVAAAPVTVNGAAPAERR